MRARRGLRAVLALPLALVLAVSLAACGGEEDSQDFTGRRLENHWQVPDVSLTATDGSPYSLAEDADDPITLVFFGYTNCPDICPLVMNNIAASMNRLTDADREQVGMVFVTTDPARDDEKTLRRYLDGYDDSFVGLTGDLDDIIALGEPLNVYVSDGKKLPTGGYDLGGHSTFVLAVEDDEAMVIWNEETSATEFATDIHTLLEED
ncbi:SCO family protein [Nocardioides sambongensis]|uniref:SCO family protein n=1 Tax=Nocardioides sambongensis TaxID=2589074 RepID=UPI0011273393|nr:SCO family protein [Nocardioides sambongensis]